MSIENLSFSMFYIQIWAKSNDLTPVRFEPSNFGSLVTHHIYWPIQAIHSHCNVIISTRSTHNHGSHDTENWHPTEFFRLKGSFTLSGGNGNGIIASVHTKWWQWQRQE